MFLTICLISLLLSSLATARIIPLATKLGIVDDPKTSPDRKNQREPIPLLGGLGFSLVAGFVSAYLIIAKDSNWLGLTGRLNQNLAIGFNFWGIVIGAILILIIGILDDKFNLNSKLMLVGVNLALILTIWLGGLSINSLSYPFDQLLPDFQFLHYFLAYIWSGKAQ
jgi:UDP-GlcNAc:undecaprenyl-phosphate GlcNAc-1-phosphate transferase